MVNLTSRPGAILHTASELRDARAHEVPGVNMLLESADVSLGRLEEMVTELECRLATLMPGPATPAQKAPGDVPVGGEGVSPVTARFTHLCSRIDRLSQWIHALTNSVQV